LVTFMPITLPRKWLQAKHLPGEFSLQLRYAMACRQARSVGRESAGHQPQT